MIDPLRIRQINDKPENPAGPVVYWMSRDQRVADNWALLFAQQKAIELHKPLAVLFCLVPEFLGAAWRQYDFMLRGLADVEAGLRSKGIAFLLLNGAPGVQIPRFVAQFRAGCLVTDFDPLKIKRLWKQQVAADCPARCYEVDAHNIVPCWQASPKQEYAAYTLRPKMQRTLGDFLKNIPTLAKHPYVWQGRVAATVWEKVRSSIKADTNVAPVTWLKPGEAAAKAQLERFVSKRLKGYNERRNDPVQDGQSDLSPYLHFGQISAQRVALAVQAGQAPADDTAAFLEELTVRRELSDNFCLYNQQYDSIQGFPDWAKKSLAEHGKDVRSYRYSLKQLEHGRTHDQLWNAAQLEMVKHGKMHGYMRMYWAKKILEWSGSARTAMRSAIYLNDRYELDGRDPNGYAGIAWSIGGVHDRAWPQRPIFGKIRYMSYNGCKSKFDVNAYIDKVQRMKS